MIKHLIAIFLILFTLPIYSQGIDVESMIKMLAVSEQKIDRQLLKKGYKYTSNEIKPDTTIKNYYLISPLANTQDEQDSLYRNIVLITCKNATSLTYQTKSFTEISNLKKELKLLDFYCSYEGDTSFSSNSLLYQHQNFVATILELVTKETIIYSIKVEKKLFPDSKNMFYADDLLYFTSHEYLVYYFGEENVKKDIYFFSKNEITKCSVLFAGTKRQVVFIWEDEVNKRTILNLLFGGQQKLKNSINKEKFISESSWLLKSGLFAGMSLYELRKINETDFNFYAGSSINAGLVLENSKGVINFKKENIILDCINCSDNQYRSTSILSVDKALKDERIMFVLTIVLNPHTANNNDNPIAGN